MSKYTLGAWVSAVSTGVIVGVNANTVSGIASVFLVMGIAYMITGTLEPVIRALCSAIRDQNTQGK